MTKPSSNERGKGLFRPRVSVWDGGDEELKEAASLLLVHPSRRATRYLAAPIRLRDLPSRRKPGVNDMELEEALSNKNHVYAETCQRLIYNS